VTVEIVLVLAVVLVAATGMVTWVRRAKSCARSIETPPGEPGQVFPGGVMCKHLITSGSLARLELFDWGVRIRGIAPARWLVPVWEARYDELAIAELVTLPYSRVAVYFRLRSDADGMAFLSERNPEILRVLERHKVPVNRSVAQVRRVAELYRSPP
jgi:hypothetical protein